MRPPEFTGGNGAHEAGARCDRHRASMRPPEFTGGNSGDVLSVRLLVAAGLQ